jgi:cellulose synthase (UDP-forming)
MTVFKVTDKSGKSEKHGTDWRAMSPFLILSLLSAAGILRVLLSFDRLQIISLIILLFWLIRNLYFLVLSLFLIDGRDSDTEPVLVIDAVPVNVETADGELLSGITTRMTEHNLLVYLDEGENLGIGTHVSVSVEADLHKANMKGMVTEVLETRNSMTRTQKIEIYDFGTDKYEYWEILYDRIPTLPQSYHRDFGILSHLWQNIAHRIARTAK